MEGKPLRKIINKIRKLAHKYHKPMKEDFLNNVTAILNSDIELDKNILKDNLKRVNNFRKVRLAYSLKYRTKNADSIIYKIRNGKSWATDFSFDNKEGAKRALDIVLGSLVEGMREKVEGKRIYIPNYIKYALPATEKQFTGDFPSGTCITVPKDIIIGIHWNNVKGNRIDLDLSLLNIEKGKIGWDSLYRSDDGDILFSGDLTDAPGEKGASELFYVKRQVKQEMILMLNYYNYGYTESHTGEVVEEVPFSIIVAKEEVKERLNKNYMIDPNNIISIAKSKIINKQKILGLLVMTTEECRFYFSETEIGNNITSMDNEYTENARKYMMQYYQNTISLNKLLQRAGAVIINDEDEEYDIDLSPNTLEKDMIINLL